MASFLLHPRVTDFLGESMHDQELGLRLGEIRVEPDDGLVGQTLSECRLGQEAGVTVLAVRRADGEWIHHVTGDLVFEGGDIIVDRFRPLLARPWSSIIRQVLK